MTAPAAASSAMLRTQRVRRRLTIRGTVQGVGFRPFVYRAACELALDGWVANSPDGVVLEAEGGAPALDALVARLRAAPPRAAVVEEIAFAELPLEGEPGFTIRESRTDAELATSILPDLATCADCLADVLDPNDRRYRYPFTNCTQCGPRFSVIERLPYDRSATSMAPFGLCPDCASEYEDPANRRFHAEATACPACGPQLALWDAEGRTISVRDQALHDAADALRNGLVVAIKGLGGFHLCVDARNVRAIEGLRARKRRPSKPLAVMFATLADVEACCWLDANESRLLCGPEAPIVLLRRRASAQDRSLGVAEAVAPHNPELGVMLPYTPLHHLLLRDLGFALVATSANLSDEPIIIDEHDARARLAGVADRFLVHDRAILRPVDDSLVRIVAGRPQMLRRSRGFAPAPLARSCAGDPVLALGGHLKATLAAASGKRIVLSQHLGTLDSPAARGAYARAIEDFLRLNGARPRIVACDMHPDYFTTRWAEQSGLELVRVQHHVAHVAACMAEHGLVGPVLGVAWDGTGFGPDGTIWGGEFLSVREAAYRRIAHLRPFPLPGAALAVREPRRSAVGLLYAGFGREMLEREELAPVASFTAAERAVLDRALARGVNAPLTSSAGRLFDAASALLGLCERASYEGEAAALLEWALNDAPGPEFYEFAVRDLQTDGGARWIVDWAPAVERLIADALGGAPRASISAAFHNGLVRAIVDVAERVGEARVVLTGGCFQNGYLTKAAAHELRRHGFECYWHERVPPNDGGLAFGQAAYASGIKRGARPCV